MRALLPLLLSGLAPACVGQILEAPPAPPGAGGAGLACEGGRGAPVATPLRRLTQRELHRSVLALTGVALDVRELPPDVRVDGFDNDAQVLSVNYDHVRAWQAAAESVSRQALAADRRLALTGCDAQAPACLDAFIARFGRLAFRRPLSAEEVADVAEHARAVADPWGQVAVALEALLQSPHFVYRVEEGRSAAPGAPRPLTGLELAARLSYGLWQEPPDEALLAAAERGELDDVEGLAAHARRMLDDPRTRDAMRELFRQGLAVRGVEGATFDVRAAPHFTPALPASALAELDLLVDEHVWADRRALGLFDAPYTFVDAALARLYGLEVTGPGMQRVALSEDSERGGLTTTAAFAMATSKFHNTSVVGRGVWVLDVLLCDRPPPPPPGVPAVEAAADQSPAEVAAQHAAPQCAGCHDRIDPVGLGLERYDPSGALRSHYANGAAVEAAGQLELAGGARAFTGGRQLGALLASDPRVQACLTKKAVRWFFGRALAAGDACTLERAGEAFAGSGHRFRELVLALVQSDAFRHLPPPGEEP